MTPEQKTVIELTAAALFGVQPQLAHPIDLSAVFREAQAQAVLPMVYTAGNAAGLDVKHASAAAERAIVSNMVSHYEHTELHELMQENGISYAVIKGAASAAYYPNPVLRTMGDVDFLIREADFPKAAAALELAGFVKESGEDGAHIAFERDGSVWEMHRYLNGIPKGKCGNVIRNALAMLPETAALHETENGAFRMPDTLQHGLILLLHTAAHLTSEGIGLRHLCDWAVFAASFSDEQFLQTFEEQLKACGLWRFAQLLTLCSMRWLHMPAGNWAGEADVPLLDALMEDIMLGGNFGKKDEDRYRQIKYIADRAQRSVDGKNTLRQVLDTLGQKAEAEHKSRLAVLADYVRLVASGERKLDNRETLRRASNRKKLYAQFHLYE